MRKKNFWIIAGAAIVVLVSIAVFYSAKHYKKSAEESEFLASKGEKFMEARELYGEATKFFYDKELEQAFLLINKSIDLHPHAVSYVLRADIYLNQGLFSQAMDDIRKAEEIDPTNETIYGVKSEILEAQGNKEDAYLNELKYTTIGAMNEKNKNLNIKYFGNKPSFYEKARGERGYVQTGLDLNLQESSQFTPMAEIGPNKGIIFKSLDVDLNGTVKLSDNIPQNNERKINAFKLVTVFLDSSKNFYSLYYEVKYSEVE